MGCSYSLQHAPIAPSDANTSAPPTHESLRARLVELAHYSTLELSPAQVCVEAQPKDKASSPALCSKPSSLPCGTSVFISMVKKDHDHFEAVATACSSLAAAGFEPVPHCPACRFDTAKQLDDTLARLRASGASRVLVLGGNDQHARAQSGAPFADAGRLIEDGSMGRNGFERVIVGGHPDGHPGLGKSVSRTASVLHAKLTALSADGHQIAIATQFSFDTHSVLSWLHETRRFVATLATVGSDARQRPTYHIGVYGPTRVKKLRRIAEICEVPSLALSSLSLFDACDPSHEGRLAGPQTYSKLEAFEALSVEPQDLQPTRNPKP